MTMKSQAIPVMTRINTVTPMIYHLYFVKKNSSLLTGGSGFYIEGV